MTDNLDDVEKPYSTSSNRFGVHANQTAHELEARVSVPNDDHWIGTDRFRIAHSIGRMLACECVFQHLDTPDGH